MLTIPRWRQACGLLLLTTGLLLGCDKKDEPGQTPKPTVTDAQLQAFIEQSGYTFYQNKPNDTLASGSPHAAFVRVRYNAKAQSVLGADGKLPAGASFPDSSIVVKEMYNAKGDDPFRIAIMMKLANAQNAVDGWVWGYYNYDATKPAGQRFISVDHSATATASATTTACVSCHKTNGNRDLNLTFRDH